MERGRKKKYLEGGEEADNKSARQFSITTTVRAGFASHPGPDASLL